MTSSNQNVDHLDALLDFTDFDGLTYNSPLLSPAASAKNTFTRPSPTTVATPSQPSESQPLTGPSHQYGLYKQQTGLVPGALASTLAVNQINPHISDYNTGFGLDFTTASAALSPDPGLFNFANPSPSQTSPGLVDIDMEFDSPPSDSHFYLPPHTVNPSAITGQESPAMPTPPNNIGRVWPGMHSQAAFVKAQAQQRQQQIIQQQQQQQQQQQPSAGKSRAKTHQPTDPIVEEKITQLLNSMRANPAQEPGSPTPCMNLPRSKKDREDMDDDERLLASEEGKRLTSKERRQLRNKVSARAFRSRRKEYITQLEVEIAQKVSDNGELLAQNRLLQEENKRLHDLSRMLLASPSFSNFLDHLSTNPQPAPQFAPQLSAPPVKSERHAEQHQMPKHINNPHAGQGSHHQISVLIPEHPVDSTMSGNDMFNFQPQVYAVLETPDVPFTIHDTSLLSGKSSNFVGEPMEADDDKMDLPPVARPKILAPEVETAVQDEAATVEEAHTMDDDFEKDPEFALYHHCPNPAPEVPVALDGLISSHVDLFNGVESEKFLARYELFDASEDERQACVAMANVQRIAARLEPVLARLEAMIH